MGTWELILIPRYHTFFWLVVGLGLLTHAAEATAKPLPSVKAPPADREQQPNAKAEARAHYEKGLERVSADAMAEALAEFQQSRRLYPTWGATSSAAVCLENLKRFDEALDLFEALLKELSNTLPAEKKAAVQQRVLVLRGRVGTIEIEGARPGATLLIDGRARGEHPSPSPLRVGAGSHIVRVYLEGFAPFEAPVEVRAAETSRLKVVLRPLLQAGRLRVVEKSGKVLDVVVDAITVGVTPWEGPIGVGEHTAMLRGQESIGTLPKPVSIRLNQRATLELTAEDLGASLQVAPVPPTASVELDGIFVGRGLWEGRLRPGAHQVRAVADGFYPKRLTLKLERGEHNAVAVPLERDPNASIWRLPARFTFEVGGALALTPSFGGDIAGKCSKDCEKSVGAGGAVAFHGGYELWNGFGFGVTAGYLSLRQTTMDRPTAIATVGHKEPDRGTADDTLKLRGFLAGGFAALKLGQRFPFRIRLGSGVVIGSVSDTRTGSFKVIDPTVMEPYAVGPVIEAPAVTWFYVDPELRAGLRLGEHFEVSAGLSALILIRLKAVRWDAKHAIYASSDGYGSFAADALASPILALLLPGISTRYDF